MLAACVILLMQERNAPAWGNYSQLGDNMSKEKARTKNLSMPSEYQRLLRKIAVIEDRNESSSVRQMIMDRAVQLGLVKSERPNLGYSNPAAAPASGTMEAK